MVDLTQIYIDIHNAIDSYKQINFKIKSDYENCIVFVSVLDSDIFYKFIKERLGNKVNIEQVEKLPQFTTYKIEYSQMLLRKEKLQKIYGC